MRWMLITLETLATGVLAIILSLVVFFTALSAYSRYVFGQVSNGAVGWDMVSLFGQHWKLAIIGILIVIFVFGGGVGFWFFSQRVHR
jgi:hypothetical protein